MLNCDQITGAQANERQSSKIALWFIVCCCLLFFYKTINSTPQNWDQVGYAAAAISLENSDPVYIHGFVYGELEKYLTDDQFIKFNEGHYRKDMSLEADAFNQQIPFYKIRIIFIGLMFIMFKLGINIFLAGHIISALTTSLGLLFFYLAYKNVIHPAFWIIAPIFVTTFEVILVAQMVIADSLAFFWVGLLCFTFMHRYWRMFFVLLATSVAVRTDMIILAALFSGYFLLLRPDLRLCAVISAIVAAGLYFTINKLTGNYGWNTIFYFVFVNPGALYPVEYSSETVSIGQYLSAVKENLREFFYNPLVLLFQFNALLHLIIFWLNHQKNTPTREIPINMLRNPALVLTLISGCYFLLHYLLFPVVWSRFFVGQYLVVSLGLLVIITSLLERSSPDFRKQAAAD